MKLTEENVYAIEHKLIQIAILEAIEPVKPEYIAGVNEMAQAVVEALQEMKNI